MYFTMELFVIILFLALSVIVLSGAFYIAQLVIERCIQITIPVIVQFYGAIRYPHEFKE